jgi:hypothetical protein
MIRNALIASAIALGTIGAAQAQDSGPRIIGGGNDQTVIYAEPSRNVVGGGLATITGGGENQSLAYSGTTSQASNGLIAEVVGGGENRQLVYRPAPSRTAIMAGQAGARQPARVGG